MILGNEFFEKYMYDNKKSQEIKNIEFMLNLRDRYGKDRKMVI